MTTTPIAAKPAPTSAAAQQAARGQGKPGEADGGGETAGAGGGFSSVLKLKLGMGLKTAMPAAQAPRSAAAKSADHPAETAPAREHKRR